MSCIKYSPLLLLLTACAGTPVQEQNGQTDNSALVNATAAAVAEKEIALFQQAITSLNNIDLEKAEADFKELTKSRPGLAGPWINLALIDVKKKNVDGAERNLAKALERNPQMAQAHNMLGFIAVSKGNMTNAVEHYRKAIALKNDYVLAHYNMALLHDIYLHDNVTAVQHYKRYLELTNNQDKKTAEWVAELERSLARGAQ